MAKRASKTRKGIAAAAFSGGGGGGIAGLLDPRRIEAAMAAAAEEGLAAGLSDKEILDAKLAARERVKGEFVKEEAARLAAAERASRGK